MQFPARLMPILEALYGCITSGHVKVVVCGTTVGGVVTPIKVDTDGKVVTTTS